jgi:sporulation protein YlmC with PRC-barrel domain
MKRLFTTTAIALLMTGAPALAQTSQEQPGSSGSQMETQQKQQDTQGQSGAGGTGYGSSGQQSGQAGKSDQTGQSGMQSDDTAQTGTEKQDKEKQAQTGAEKQDKEKQARTGAGGGLEKETRASNLIGASVVNASGETIGEISDILFSQDGGAKRALIGVGGFLGIGQKNVAVEFSELDISRDENNNLKVTTSMTAESLENMPSYEEKSAGMDQEGQGSQGSGMQQDQPSGQTGGQSGQSESGKQL